MPTVNSPAFRLAACKRQAIGLATTPGVWLDHARCRARHAGCESRVPLRGSDNESGRYGRGSALAYGSPALPHGRCELGRVRGLCRRRLCVDAPTLAAIRALGERIQAAAASPPCAGPSGYDVTGQSQLSRGTTARRAWEGLCRRPFGSRASGEWELGSARDVVESLFVRSSLPYPSALSFCQKDESDGVARRGGLWLAAGCGRCSVAQMLSSNALELRPESLPSYEFFHVRRSLLSGALRVRLSSASRTLCSTCDTAIPTPFLRPTCNGREWADVHAYPGRLCIGQETDHPLAARLLCQTAWMSVQPTPPPQRAHPPPTFVSDTYAPAHECSHARRLSIQQPRTASCADAATSAHRT